MQLSARTAARLKRLDRTTGRGPREQCGMNHMQPMRYFAISQLWKMHAGLGIAFIGQSHLFRGVFPRELAKMHFLRCLCRTDTAWWITAPADSGVSSFSFVYLEFVSLQVAIYNCVGTGLGGGGLKHLMEQCVWISCRIFVRLELSSVVQFAPSLPCSLRPCG